MTNTFLFYFCATYIREYKLIDFMNAEVRKYKTFLFL